MSHSMGKHRTGYQHQTQYFEQIPGPPAIVDQLPVVFVHEDQRLEEVVGEHRDRRAAGQAIEDLIVGPLFLAIVEHPVADGAFHDDHRQSGEDAGRKEQDRDELGIPQGMDLGLCQQKEGAET